jgi:hypothetical protein
VARKKLVTIYHVLNCHGEYRENLCSELFGERIMELQANSPKFARCFFSKRVSDVAKYM